MKAQYGFDFTTKTLTITKAFAEKASNPENAEYKLLMKFHNDFPNLSVRQRTHRTPSSYKNANGTKTKNNQFKGLSVKRMEKYINALPNKDKFLTPFNFLKDNASYTRLAQWFMAQFPDYRENPLFYLTNDVKVIDYSAYSQEKKEKQKANIA